MNNPPSFLKTRIAPTPSGYLHLGNVLSFLITTALARRHRATVFLRIDDLDKTRTKDNYIIDIFETLNFLEIPYNEGPKDMEDFKKNYSQIHRLDLYIEALADLTKKEAYFACICSRKLLANSGDIKGYAGYCKQLKIPISKKGCCWRFKTNMESTVSVNIYPNHLTSIPFPDEMRDFVIRKKDMYPAYQLSSVVDDLHFGIDLIVRGVDLWNSTLAQIQLAKSLSDGTPFLSTAFHHHLLMKDGESKLAKSSGSTSIQYLRRNGAKKGDIYRLISEFLKFPIPATNLEEFTMLYFRTFSQQ